MDNQEEQIRKAYGGLVDDFVDTTDDPEAQGVRPDGTVSAEDYLKNPEKFTPEALGPSKEDPLGLCELPVPTEEKPAIERSAESVAAEEARYIRQAIQNTGARRVHSTQTGKVAEALKKLLSPDELGRVVFVNKLDDKVEPNIGHADMPSVDQLFGQLGR